MFVLMHLVGKGVSRAIRVDGDDGWVYVYSINIIKSSKVFFYNKKSFVTQCERDLTRQLGNII